MQSNVINFKKIDEILNLKGKNKRSIIDAKLKNQRENRIIEYNKRQELLGTIVKKYHKKIKKIHQENVTNNKKKLEDKHQKAEKIQLRLQNHKTLECRKNAKILNFIKNKDIKSQKLLAERKYQRLSEKQKRANERFYNKVEYQKITLVKNQQLIDKCLENKTFNSLENNQELSEEYEEEINDGPIEEIITEEECIIDSDQSKLEMIHNQTNLDNVRVYLERIAMLKKNFYNCETGRHFLQKLGPIWDSLTQCFYRKSLILKNMAKNSDNMMPDGFRKIYEKINLDNDKNVTKRSLGLDASFLEIFITDLDFELSDEDVNNALTKAKYLIDKSTTAFDVMNLVKFILEHEIDVNENVLYIVNGICRRTVFEYAKKRMSYRMLERSKNTINRLKFLNKNNLIPKQYLITKNNENYVEPIVFDFLTNDVKYGYLTSEETITEYNMYPNNAQIKMEAFWQKLNFCYSINIPSMYYENVMENIFKMPEKYCLENHVDIQVDRLIAFAYKHLASNLSGKSNTSTSYHNIKDVEELTNTKFNILARKMTKMLFGMGGSYEEKIYVLEVVMKHIVNEIAKRSPKVLYKYKNKHKAVSNDTKIDMSFFLSKP
ncbi:hypothetical protein AGLY_004457 [Aphis glycines]|uniref:Uncharacterized protein n=1 Tax=Aphis glycines TaxID=307491 RepID=A0A6G0TY44_APHGL|nr:hypothetical protein AGLY_004457 [Aphis glycines]